MTGEGKLAMTVDLAKSLVEWERKASRTAFEGPSLTKALPGGGQSAGWATDPRLTWVRMSAEWLLASLDHTLCLLIKKYTV